MKKIFKNPDSLKKTYTHYCPGCGHGIVHRLICEVIDELNIREKVIGVTPVGCAVTAYEYWNFDCCEAAHGRALAVATGIKRMRPSNIVFTYQGDGDLAAIGAAETLHAANRGENLSVIFINNTVYGMTGGQLAPTTLLKQKTATTPGGRDPATEGYPLKISELLSTLRGVAYIERVSTSSPKKILSAKKAINKAFINQVENKGFSMVEVLSQCPVYLGLTPAKAVKWLDEVLTKEFPLGRIK
jgi:2-oxoglutarate ferredoxin oxidoreductase subunit beta